MRSETGSERGSAVVEFALVLPMLFLIGLALVQIVVLARDELVVTQAARAGARAAAVDPDEARVRDAVATAAIGLSPDRMTVAVTRSGTRGDPVLVRVGYRSPVAGPLAGWLFPAEVSLSADATMRQEFG